MIEEFMLAANVSVAEKILKHFPDCSLLRYAPGILQPSGTISKLSGYVQKVLGLARYIL